MIAQRERAIALLCRSSSLQRVDKHFYTMQEWPPCLFCDRVSMLTNNTVNNITRNSGNETNHLRVWLDLYRAWPLPFFFRGRGS